MSTVGRMVVTCASAETARSRGTPATDRVKYRRRKDFVDIRIAIVRLIWRESRRDRGESGRRVMLSCSTRVNGELAVQTEFARDLMTKRVCLTMGLLLLSSSAAFGQMLKPGDGRIFAAANVGAQFSPARAETTAFSFTIYEEAATVNVARSVKGGLLGEFTAGGRVLGNLGVAGSLWFRSAPGDGAVTASIPDPAFFDRPRSVSTTVTNMKHDEMWMAVQASYSMQLNERMAVYFLGGPTVVNVKHQVADTATVAESGNFATVTIGTKDLSKVVFGYTLAADGRYMITKNIGLGGFIRYSGAKANLNDTVNLTLGGLSIGAGVRLAIF